MKIALVVVLLLVLLVIAGVLWIGMPKGPTLSEVAHLQNPEKYLTIIRYPVRNSGG